MSNSSLSNIASRENDIAIKYNAQIMFSFKHKTSLNGSNDIGMNIE